MPPTKVDFILHPVRLRILLALAGRHLTAQQVAQALPDVPQASLYRHLRLLVDARLLVIDETRPVRGGVVEKIYAFGPQAGVLTLEDIASVSRDDHLRFFTLFLTQVLRDFAHYLEREQMDFAADVRYHQVPLYLSDDEFQEFVHDMTVIMQARQNHPPLPGRRRRMLTSVILPIEDDEPRP